MYVLWAQHSWYIYIHTLALDQLTVTDNECGIADPMPGYSMQPAWREMQLISISILECGLWHSQQHINIKCFTFLVSFGSHFLMVMRAREGLIVILFRNLFSLRSINLKIIDALLKLYHHQTFTLIWHIKYDVKF